MFGFMDFKHSSKSEQISFNQYEMYLKVGLVNCITVVAVSSCSCVTVRCMPLIIILIKENPECPHHQKDISKNIGNLKCWFFCFVPTKDLLRTL